MTNPIELPCAACKPRVFHLMAAKAALSVLALAAGLGAGCGSARPSKYYQLTVPGNSAPAPGPNTVPVTLLIGRITSSSLYHEEQIVYNSAGESMGTYEYHRWSEPPTEMIGDILLRELRVSGNYRAVYSLRSDIHGDYLLHGRLFDFKAVEGSQLMGRVTMELELRDIKKGTSVWSHFYTHDEPASGKDIGAVVAALDKNVQQAMAEFRQQLGEFFAQNPPAPPAP